METAEYLGTSYADQQNVVPESENRLAASGEDLSIGLEWQEVPHMLMILFEYDTVGFAGVDRVGDGRNVDTMARFTSHRIDDLFRERRQHDIPFRQTYVGES